jgi:hypothetical protein
VYSTNKIDSGLLDSFSFISLIFSGIVKRDLVHNIPYMVVKLPVTSVPVISTRFLNVTSSLGAKRQAGPRTPAVQPLIGTAGV